MKPETRRTISQDQITGSVLLEVHAERVRQDEKWGEQNHDPALFLTILTEEVGEVARAILDKDTPGYREELIQVAAVAVSIVEAFDRAHGSIAHIERQRAYDAAERGEW